MSKTSTKRVALAVDVGVGLERHTRAYDGMVLYGRERGWDLIIDEFPELNLSARRTPDVAYDGIIARATKPMRAAAERLGIPLVNLWLNSPVASDVPGIFIDYLAVGRLAAEHLLLRGFKRFAALADSTIASKESTMGFHGTIEEAGFASNTAFVEEDITSDADRWSRSKRIMQQWVDRFEPPVGVLTQRSEAGRLITQMCQRRGLRVPEDVAIVTGSDERAFCEGLSPTLTSIDLGFQRQGHGAAHLLDRLMQGIPPPEHPIRLPPLGIQVRESTDFLQVDDELISNALQFIAAHCHKPIDLVDVADAVSVGATTIKRRFKSYLGRGVATQIRLIRLERAKREVAQGNRSFAKIAQAVGFGSYHRLFSIFRRELGMTPSAYRKKHQGIQTADMKDQS